MGARGGDSLELPDLKAEGVDSAPERTATTWAGFLRSQADVLPAMDFIETITLTGQRQYILAVTEHATRRSREYRVAPAP
ncbi:transposase [Streptomyces sp. NPDC002596]